MKRREAIVASGLVLVAGCSSSSPDTDSEPDPNTTNSSQSESDPQPATITVGEVTSADSVSQGDGLTVSALVTSSTNATATVTLTDESGAEIGSSSVAITPDTEEISVRLPVSAEAPVGNSTVSVVVDGGGVTEQATKQIEIAEFVPEWKQLYNRAVTKTEAFLDEFAAVGSESDDRSILDTSISSGYNFSGSITLSEASDLSFEALKQIDSDMGGARNQVERLRDEIQMLDELGRTQDPLCDLYTDLNNLLDNRRDPDELDTAADNVRDRQQTLSESISNLDPVVGDQYDAKISQMDAEITAVKDIIEPISDYRSAQDSFDDGSYGAAANEARVAETGFDSVLDDIENPDAYQPTDSVDDGFVSLIEDWQEAAIDLQSRAAEEQSDSGY